MSLAENLAGSVGTETLNHIHSAAVVKNEIDLIGARVMVAVDDALISAEAVYIHASERLEAPKAIGAITAGATVYWDNTAKNMTTTVGANTKCGIALEDAASSDANVVMRLDNSVNY